MHQNRYWIFFLTAIMTSIVLYTGYTFFQIYQYDRLSVQVTIDSIQWSVFQENDERFFPQATYQITFHNNIYKGQNKWEEYFLNAATAQEMIDRTLSQQVRSVWIDSSNPHFSSLQKTFPFKHTIYMMMLWALALYFIGVGRYVTQYKERGSYANNKVRK